MPDMLTKGARWLANTQRTHATERVHYVRTPSTLRVRAMRGQSQFDVTDSEGQLTRVDSHDFLIHAEDLLIDGIPSEPQTGDRIITGELTDGQAYEVSGIPGQPMWRWSDDHRIRYRIHTKHVGAHP